MFESKPGRRPRPDPTAEPAPFDGIRQSDVMSSRSSPFVRWLGRLALDSARVGAALGAILEAAGRVLEPLAQGMSSAGAGIVKACRSVERAREVIETPPETE